MLTPSQTHFRIFVSHSHVDDQFGVKLVDDLRRTLGENWTIWYDSHGGLHGGDEWWDKILKELALCDVFIIILSPASVSSDWVNKEITITWRHMVEEKNKKIIPVLYRQCNVRDDIGSLQIISFLPPQTYKSAFSDLLTAIGEGISQLLKAPSKSGAQITSPIISPQPIPSFARHLRIKPLVFVGLMLALLIAVSSIGYFYIKGSNSITCGSSITGNNSITVSNSNTAAIYATATCGNPTFYDPLNGSLPSDFSQTSSTNYGCRLTGNAYYIWAEQPGSVTNCWTQNTAKLSDFAFQVQMTIIRGDYGGLIFRYNGSDQYRFSVGQNGTYGLIVTVNGDRGPGGSCCEKLAEGSSQAMKQGLNQTNLLTVVADGSNIYLYINGKYVNHVTDSSISSGQIGLFAYSDSQPTGVDFSNAKVWTL